MTSELDHVFICVSVGGEEARALRAFGLTEGTPNVHPGQGTACRRFFRPQSDKLSPEMTAVTGAGLVQLHSGSEYLVEFGFDGESQGQRADFRPLLPLVFRW